MSDVIGLISTAIFLASALCGVWMLSAQWGITAALLGWMAIGAFTYPGGRK